MMELIFFGVQGNYAFGSNWKLNYVHKPRLLNHRGKLHWPKPSPNHKIWLHSDWRLNENLPLLNHKAPGRHFHFAPIGSTACFHHPLLIPLFNRLESYPFITPPLYPLTCHDAPIPHRETIRGQIKLSWALPLWNATKNRDWCAAALLPPLNIYPHFFFFSSSPLLILSSTPTTFFS